MPADVDAARGLVEKQDPGFREEPLSDDDLLLGAAGEIGDARGEGGRANREGVDLTARRLGPGVVVEQDAPDEAPQRRQRQVLEHRRSGTRP